MWSGSRSGFQSPDLAEVTSRFIDNTPARRCVVFAKLEYLIAKKRQFVQFPLELEFIIAASWR